MRRVKRTLAAGVVVLTIGVGAVGVQPAAPFVVCGSAFRPIGLSTDGTLVVGSAPSATQGRTAAHKWRPSTMSASTALDGPAGSIDSYAWDAGDDGAVIVGYRTKETGFPNTKLVARPVAWRPNGAGQELSVPAGYEVGHCFGISADASVMAGTIVKLVEAKQIERAARWVNGGAENLGPIDPNDPDSTSSASGCSPNGTFIVGAGSDRMGRRPLLWSKASGMTVIDRLPNHATAGGAAVSDGGDVVVGSGTLASGLQGFWWRRGQRAQPLESLPGDSETSATCLTSDGRLAGGLSRVGEISHAVLWRENDAPVDLNNYLPRLGVQLGGAVLTRVVGIAMSQGDVALCGVLRRDGTDSAWWAKIPPLGLAAQTYAVTCDSGVSARVDVDVVGVGVVRFQWEYLQPNPDGSSEWRECASDGIPGTDGDPVFFLVGRASDGLTVSAASDHENRWQSPTLKVRCRIMNETDSVASEECSIEFK